MSHQNAKINLTTRLTYLKLPAKEAKMPVLLVQRWHVKLFVLIFVLQLSFISTWLFHKAQPHIHKTSTGEYLPPAHFHGQNQMFASSNNVELWVSASTTWKDVLLLTPLTDYKPANQILCDNLHCSHAAHIHLCVTRPCKWKTAWRCTVACLVLNEVKTVGGHRFDYIYREKQSDWQPDACSKPQNSSIHPVCIFLQRGGNYKPFVRNKVAVWDILALD